MSRLGLFILAGLWRTESKSEQEGQHVWQMSRVCWVSGNGWHSTGTVSPVDVLQSGCQRSLPTFWWCAGELSCSLDVDRVPCLFYKCIGVTLNASRFRTVSLKCQSYATILWESKQLLCLNSTRGSETAKSLGRPERKVLVDANAAMWSALNVIISTGAAIDLTEAPSVYADHLVLSAHKNPCVF